MVSQEEKNILRELAKKYAYEASKDVNNERRERARRINECKEDRPIVWIEEIPWNQINVNNELTLLCKDPFAREMEDFFRKQLFRWKYFQADSILEPVYTVNKSFSSSGYGVEVEENIRKIDKTNNIVSHEYIDVLKNEEDIEKLKAPVIIRDERADERNLETAQDILNGIMNVHLSGISYIYHAPWDLIARLRGADNILLDLALRPEFMHALIKKFTEIQTFEIDEYIRLGLLDGYCTNLHCTPGYTKTLPGSPESGGTGNTKDMWFRQMAQLFSSVSPAMYNEFDIEYAKELQSRFGLVYFGCCEPLDNVIPYLKRIPNLRKVGVSPWADVNSCAEQLGKDYVMARKPNPSLVAEKTDKDVVRKELADTINACRANHCAFDYVLKDISSCGYNLQNLIDWNDTVMNTLDEYY